jgi:hypothetical protein
MNIRDQREMKIAKKISQKGSHLSLNAIVEQPKNCPFGVDTTIELKNIINTTDNNGTVVIYSGTFHLTSVCRYCELYF